MRFTIFPLFIRKKTVTPYGGRCGVNSILTNYLLTRF